MARRGALKETRGGQFIMHAGADGGAMAMDFDGIWRTCMTRLKRPESPT